MHGKEKAQEMIIVDSVVARTKLPDEWPTLLGYASYSDAVGLTKIMPSVTKSGSIFGKVTRGLKQLWQQRSI